MIDFHTHILPNIDDGAKDVVMLEKMLVKLQGQGITEIVLTPHFYPHLKKIAAFVSKRNERFEESKNIFDNLGIKVHLGAEVFLLETLLSKENISDLCIDGGNYILIEIPFSETSVAKIISLINKLSINFDVTPIIAHIDRYPKLFKRQFLEEMAELGCLVQFNIECLDNLFMRRRIKRFLREDLIHLAGSDCHNTTTRKPNFSKLKKCLSKNLIDKIEANGNKIFQ